MGAIQEERRAPLSSGGSKSSHQHLEDGPVYRQNRSTRLGWYHHVILRSHEGKVTSLPYPTPTSPAATKKMRSNRRVDTKPESLTPLLATSEWIPVQERLSDTVAHWKGSPLRHCLHKEEASRVRGRLLLALLSSPRDSSQVKSGLLDTQATSEHSKGQEYNRGLADGRVAGNQDLGAYASR